MFVGFSCNSSALINKRKVEIVQRIDTYDFHHKLKYLLGLVVIVDCH